MKTAYYPNLTDFSESSLKSNNVKSWTHTKASLNGNKRIFTAYVTKEDNWWIGWVQGVRGAISQERTRKQLLQSLKELVPEMIEDNPDVFLNAPESNWKPIQIEL